MAAGARSRPPVFAIRLEDVFGARKISFLFNGSAADAAKFVASFYLARAWNIKGLQLKN